MAQQVAILFTHVGLTGVDPVELGGNHPEIIYRAYFRDAFLSGAGGLEPGGKLLLHKPPLKPSLKPGQKPGQNPANENLRKTGPVEEVHPGALRALIMESREDRKIHKGSSAAQRGHILLARQIKAYMHARGLSAREAAHELGLSRSHAQNLLRLLTLPQSVQDHVSAGRMTGSHARAISKMRDPEAMARLIISRDLSVRAAETLALRLRYIAKDGQLLRATAMPRSYEAERLLAEILQNKVRFKDRGGRGTLCIDYRSPEQAQDIVNRLTGGYFEAGAGEL